MKKIIFLIAALLIMIDNSSAQNVTTLGAGEESSTSGSSYSSYCNPEIKKIIKDINESRIKVDNIYINSQNMEQKSVMPSGEDNSSACFVAPELSTQGIADKLKATYNGIAQNITSVIDGSIGLVGGIIDNIGGLLTGDPGSLLQSFGGALNQLCLSLVEETTDVAKSVLNLGTFTNEFTTISYVSDNFSVNNNTISFTTAGIENSVGSATANILDPNN